MEINLAHIGATRGYSGQSSSLRRYGIEEHTFAVRMVALITSAYHNSTRARYSPYRSRCDSRQCFINQLCFLQIGGNPSINTAIRPCGAQIMRSTEMGIKTFLRPAYATHRSEPRSGHLRRDCCYVGTEHCGVVYYLVGPREAWLNVIGRQSPLSQLGNIRSNIIEARRAYYDSRSETICKRTKLIVFLGTPH
jgi:hypothetical protein